MTGRPGRRGRAAVAVLLLVSLVAMAGMRAMVQRRHEQILPRPRTGSRLSQMNTFALGLVLGGLRGPLVMFLWSSSENQKTERNLEDIDTKIELIRMLQPEFDSVHIFQIWNKAYNISVQMANLQNKYTTILDALRYARSVDVERPDNINILVSMAEVYFQKLGSSQERWYYIPRVREETLPRKRPERLRREDPAWRPTQHEPLLDERGMVLPELLKPRPDLAGKSYNGAELQFLERYSNAESGGFPYGLSPRAIGFNYYERARLLQETTGQRHLHMSDSVISSRSGVSLRDWAVEAWQHGRSLEMQALGHAAPDPKMQPEEWWKLEPLTAAQLTPTGSFTDTSDRARRLVEEAVFTYRRGAEVAGHAEGQYRRHVNDPTFAADVSLYSSQIDSAAAMASLLAADHQYLAAAAAAANFQPAVVPKEQAQALLKSAADSYRQAIERYQLLMLKFYVEDEAALSVYPQVTGQKLDKTTIQKADPKLFPVLIKAVQEYHAKPGARQSMHAEDFVEYLSYIERAQQRLSVIP